MIRIIAVLSILSISLGAQASAPIKCSAFLSDTTVPVSNSKIAIVKTLLTKQEQTFDRLFPTLGIKSYSDFEIFLKESNDPLVKKAISIVQEDKFEIIMARSENARDRVAQTGFLNQFQTGTSSGVQDLELRTDLESTMMAMTAAEHKSLDNELKPKYFSIRLKSETGVESPVMVSPRYGTDIYTFKKDLVSDRLTFFPGDSLDHVKGKIANDNLGFAHHSVTPSKLEMIFLPWSRRLLMVPFMLTELAANRFGAPVYNPRDYRVPLVWTAVPHPYWEAQIFGPVDFDHVERFEFRQNPPEGLFLNELLNHKIPIFDGRTQPAKLWNPT